MAKKILIGALVLFLLIQFFSIDRNESNVQTNALSTKYAVPVSVEQSLRSACNDCHSNESSYPWYSKIQPVAWWLQHHIEDGKRHLNFSEFTSLPIAVQNHKFEEVIETIREAEMPLPSYTWFGLHKDANLSEDQKNEIMAWAQRQMDSLKSVYPADSLKLKRRPMPS